MCGFLHSEKDKIMFIPNKHFIEDYNKLYKKSPEAANLLLLLCEIADENGRVYASEEQIGMLMVCRFNDPSEHQFKVT